MDTVGIDAVNSALDDACRKLGAKPQPDNFIGTIRSALFLTGSFIKAIDQHPKGKGFSLEQLKALTVGANELWTKGRAVYRGFVLIAERTRPTGIRIRAERVS